MNNRLITKISALMAMCFLAVGTAGAFSTTKYATQSKLASGKWVKIAIPETGVYELTAQELADMGFTNPENVRVYGSGGNMISEVLDGTAPDDLNPVPVQRLNGKICFYALGPVAFELTSPLTATPHFTREVNAYSTHGYYFLTEETTPELAMATSAGTTVITTPDARKTSYDFYWHERDLCSLGFSGKDLLGEDITLNGGTFDFTLPSINTLSKLYVNTAVGANISASGYVKTYLEIGGQRDTVSYTASSSKIYPPSSAYVYYNYASPTSAITPKRHNEQGVLQTMVTTSTGTIKTAKLDYFIITYERNNYLSNKDNANQFRLAFSSLTDDAQIMLPKASEDLVLWNVQVPSAPVACQLTSIPDEDQPSVINRCYAPGYASRVEYFVAFDPTAELKKISGFSRVENQDLHGMPVPDMLIVTSKELKSEAQRIADMHRDTDGIDVAVVEQDQIYNEFSSGTPDAMAVRLINKMFYDRDNNKFKYLLLFGPGSFDNRGLSTDKANRVITYESDISNDEDYSYTSDDFFGMLDDNSGNDISSDMLRLGIGRITSRDVSEAKSDVDKLIKYVTEPDYGPWRNNFMAICDEGDGGMHMFQAEGICDILTEELETGLQIEKVYSPMYPKASTLSEPGVAENERTAINAKKHLKELLATGQYFSTYVGHANPTRFSKVSNLWTITDVNETSYEHMPIMITACCNVARYDSDNRGISEVMFHKPDGGAIAMVTTSREVYAEANDKLNIAFTRAMMGDPTTTTIGDAYMKCKQHFGVSSNTNKMSFLLLGDPAMKLNYPQPCFKITKINGIDIDEDGETVVNSGPLQLITVEANVVDTQNNNAIDTNFTGDATLTLYDVERAYADVSYRVDRVKVTRQIDFPRNVLAQVNGRVNNGLFTGSVVVPRYILAQEGDTCAIKVYAHKDNSDRMVNGEFNTLIFTEYNEQLAVDDTQAPVITQMCFNDPESFNEGDLVDPNSTLIITAEDNCNINTQSLSIGSSMTLTLDGGKVSYPLVKNYAVVSDEGRTLNINFPMSDLEVGHHTLTFTVHDAAGNAAHRTIAFVVGTESKATLSAQQNIVSDNVVFDIETALKSTPQVKVTVLNATGQVVWKTTTSTFPITWNLLDTTSTHVPAGVYTYFGTYETDTEFGGTPIKELIIIEPVKR